MKLTTTLKLLREHDACKDGYRKLRKHLDRQWADDEPIDLLTILDSNGMQDTLWCLRSTREDSRRVAALIAADCAERVLQVWESRYPDDDRPRKAIEAARAGDPNAANAAARSAAYAAYAAANAACAARAAADAAARAAYAAACAARAAADAAARAACAARAAADAAARAATDAANAAYADARDSELAAQAVIIRKHLTE